MVRRQREDGPASFAEINFKFDPEGKNPQVENWATYFQELATPKQLPQFDPTHEEHMKNAHPVILTAHSQATNKVLTSQEVPDSLKLGAITPVAKKGKSKYEPDSYRRITVTSITGKLIEMEMVPHSRKAMAPTSSKNQYGFKEGVSCNNAALLITEAQMEMKDQKKPLYTAYMDSSKAFDVVHHDTLLCALHNQGV